MTTTSWRRLILLGGLAVPPALASAQTNGFVLHCLSARAASEGCVTRARDDVPTNLFHDPASLSWFSQPALEANLSSFMPSLTFRNSANARVDGARHAYPMASMAYVGPKVGSRWSWGIGLEPIGGFGSDFSLRHDLLGEGLDYESFFAALKAGPAVSLDLLPGLSLGASAYLTYARINDFRMPFAMPPQAAAGMGMIVGMDEHYPGMFNGATELTAYGDSRDFAGWGRGVSVGLGWRMDDLIRVSASWSPRSTITLDGASATIDMNRQFEAMFAVMVQERMMYHGMSAAEAQTSVAQALSSAGMDLALGTVARYDAATELSEPQTAGVGMAIRLSPRWSVALEGVWMD
ncbi:MAG TPA: outer membrane protein transport protein, partial [Gemmatimonadaceae bacterium]